MEGDTKKRKSMKSRILSLLMLLSILLPTIAMTTYAASSEKFDFQFHFNGGSGVFDAQGYKAENSGDYAGITVTSLLGAGTAIFHINDATNYSVTDKVYFTASGNKNVLYNDGAYENGSGGTVYLIGTATGSVFSAIGRFQP